MLSSKLDEELSILRREKRNPARIEFPFSCSTGQSPKNYDEYLEAIVQQRTGDQLRQRQIEVSTCDLIFMGSLRNVTFVFQLT